MSFLRTFDFQVDENRTVKLRELSFEDYFEFSETGRAMIDDKQITPKDWINRQLGLIARCIVEPGVADGWSAALVGKEFGKRVADRMYAEILKFSGLDQPKDRPQLGEDEAATDTSQKKSVAA